ncbi:Glycerophosphoryl diester phosphodiesterase [Blastochloris viridis]|uniref:Glycerophosphoryl diester phosphodiesterase n=2 Tax=Blastochloris viridis TaxID=1079 RepID=A0A0H5BK20_BLAVI|nr:Glycerophosphoryl diester phosphodiesterase [Blastochloris viridis]BAS00877.1 glycerophosphoryl diester phosphodiesterase [Blastochloris viridis]CUU41915.1 Glycerophosphoryl diester phosphodiesterase [Blastochloris viridis]
MAPGWLTARPIAHRGLHDPAAGVVENTRSSCAAAIAAGYAIEVDLERSADGEAMVFHDDTLDRLTEATGPLAALSARELQAVRFRATGDAMLRFCDLLALVAGRVPLIVELKSRFDGDLRLAVRAAEVAAGYAGPLAMMSFDPDLVAALRRLAPDVVRGITAERHYDDAEWTGLTRWQKQRLGNLLHLPSSRAQFVAFGIRDLPSAATWLARHGLGLPLLTWTVRTNADRARARRWADQIIFEGLRP